MSEKPTGKQGNERRKEHASQDRKRLEDREDRRENRVKDLRKSRQHAERHLQHARLQQLTRVDGDEIEDFED